MSLDGQNPPKILEKYYIYVADEESYKFEKRLYSFCCLETTMVLHYLKIQLI